MGWHSGFRRKLFGILQSYAYTVSGKKCSPARDSTGDIIVMELFNGISEQTSELYLQFCTHSLTVLTHAVH